VDVSTIYNILQAAEKDYSKIIKDLLKEHKARHIKMKKLYERYKATENGVPIFSRKFLDENKINNKLNNDFFGDIIDTKIGYFAGKPITYNIDPNMYKQGDTIDEVTYNKHIGVISDFNIRNNIDDVDSETAKRAAICGYGARLLYIDREGKEKIMNIEPWEAIFVEDGSINELQYAMRYYPVRITEDDKTFTRTKVEWYDNKYITFLIENEKGEFIYDTSEDINPKPHMFDYVPLICFPNNDEMLGDVEKVLNLIDGYDNTLSDVNSELEQFRLAYMAFYGSEPTVEVIKAARKTGAFGLDKEDKIEFITKTLNDTVIEHHLNRLEENILRFAKSVNFNDESFGGTITGIAMKFKMFGLESKCITAERKFTAALRQQFKILTTAWHKKGINIDYTNIFFMFKRNFPLNLLDEAETTSKFKGLVSERTRLSLLSFVDDVDYELSLIKQENEDAVDLDNV